MGNSNEVMVLFARIFTAINTETECNVQHEIQDHCSSEVIFMDSLNIVRVAE
jgi:hypothetical protein